MEKLQLLVFEFCDSTDTTYVPTIDIIKKIKQHQDQLVEIDEMIHKLMRTDQRFDEINQLDEIKPTRQTEIAFELLKLDIIRIFHPDAITLDKLKEIDEEKQYMVEEVEEEPVLTTTTQE